MMKSGAPPDKVGVLSRLLPIEFHGFTSRIDFEGLSLFGYWSYLNFAFDVNKTANRLRKWENLSSVNCISFHNPPVQNHPSS